MAALEVIALDEATPQLRAPGSGDTYTMPRALTVQGPLTINDDGFGGSFTIQHVGTETDRVSWAELTSVNNAAFGDGYYCLLVRGTKASPLPVQDGDTLGTFGFGGQAPDGIAYGGAQILARVTGTPNALQIPTALIFSTRNLGSAIAERMRITSDGKLGVGTSAPVCRFHAVAPAGDEVARFGVSVGSSNVRVDTYDSGSGGANTNTGLYNNCFNNDGYGDGFYISYSRGTQDSPTILLDGDYIGSYNFGGRATSFEVTSAWIGATVTGSPSGGNVPMSMDFNVGQNGAAPTRMRITNNGNIGIGTTAPNAAAQLEIASTTRGFLLPRMTTTQRDAISSPPDGLMIYNSTTNKFQGRANNVWVDFH